MRFFIECTCGQNVYRFLCWGVVVFSVRDEYSGNGVIVVGKTGIFSYIGRRGDPRLCLRVACAKIFG